MTHLQKLVVVIGATASGKTEAAMAIAHSFDGEVVNADSRLFYRGMDIGTAKPSRAQLAGVRHHLIDFVEPDQKFSLAQFLKCARKTIADIGGRGKLPVMAGGTGQYVWGLLEDWQVPEVEPDEELRQELESVLVDRGVEALYDRLRQADPAVAERTDRRNHRRIIRAIERVEAGVKGPASRGMASKYDALIIGLNVERAELHRRTAERVDLMLARGWLEETQALLDRGIAPSMPAMSAIGYRELAAHIRGQMSLELVREKTIHATSRLIRHQNNWFKLADKRITWVDVTDGNTAKTLEHVSEWLASRA